MVIKKTPKKKATKAPSSEPVNKVIAHASVETGPATSFIVTFQIEGHSKWRHSTFSSKGKFDEYLNHPNQSKHPKVIVKRWFVLDHITGNITEEK